jgi:hypothetical protein
MVLQLSREQAAHMLARYHFLPTDLSGVFLHCHLACYHNQYASVLELFPFE